MAGAYWQYGYEYAVTECVLLIFLAIVAIIFETLHHKLHHAVVDMNLGARRTLTLPTPARCDVSTKLFPP